MAQQHSVVTWDPVSARWIHESGPEMSTPATPPDVHAIQSYFFDPEEHEWVATVLAPWGRQLAAQWEGAYKVPDRTVPPTKNALSKNALSKNAPGKTGKKTSPAPLLAIVLVVLIVGGAAAVVAGTQNAPNATAAPVPIYAPVAVSAEPPATSADATPAPTQQPGGTPVPTRPPARTTAPTAPPPPAGSAITLADGSVVTYSGPSRIDIGVGFTATFSVRNANNTPGTGTLLVSLGNQSTGGAKTSSGTLSPSGQLTLSYSGAALPGNYPFVVNYKGQQGQVAILRVG